MDLIRNDKVEEAGLSGTKMTVSIALQRTVHASAATMLETQLETCQRLVNESLPQMSRRQVSVAAGG